MLFKQLKLINRNNVSPNILFGNIILENLNKMKVKKFINLSTVWENYNSIKDDNPNLYSVYKKSFSHLINFYKKKINTSFYNIMLSDTVQTWLGLRNSGRH